MDKAVDVVADRLNNLGAQFLALRAGRLNYQRQLSYELNDLLAGKVDLDDGAEDYMTADIQDMKEHLDKMRSLEKKCDKIIRLEKNGTICTKKSKLADFPLIQTDLLQNT